VRLFGSGNIMDVFILHGLHLVCYGFILLHVCFFCKPYRGIFSGCVFKKRNAGLDIRRKKPVF